MKPETMLHYLKYFAREYGEVFETRLLPTAAVVRAEIHPAGTELFARVKFVDNQYAVRLAVSKNCQFFTVRGYTCEFFSLKRFEQTLQQVVEYHYHCMEK